ncbi:ATP-grasp domain-containing protein [Paraburkholderia bonniea]|uniref:ATP-grasp domain-containing protein n=1 Tax=Paraburkholderia bonniea TaxID=2152891 RepID=UPI001290CE07|nr:ATP-grasp domain-containing protein [Paraburkholderia bonniea]WJF91711.1 ATP-grasp domain-containing protein [Paraburkholderia bonniea]WJF95031.1 ATP-grasp domain-containing protein [Paraburkholderia bonniea]
MRIMITGAGGPAAISIWKSLYPQHELHMADMDPCAAGLYLVPAAQRLIVPRGDSPEFVGSVQEACRVRGIEMLLSTVDAELVPVAEAASSFEAGGTRVPLSPVETLRLCRDKYLLLEHLKHAVPVPEFGLLSAATLDQALVFPLFAKPRLGAGSRGIALIHHKDDLRALPLDGSYLLQEWLPGEEYSVDCYVRSDGVVLAAVPRDRMKTDSGIAVASRTRHLDELIEAGANTAQVAGIRYVANVQFKRASDGRFKLLEINPRFPGTLPLTTAAGIDIPALLVADVRGEPLPDTLLPFRELMVVRYWTEQFFDPGEWTQLCRP